MVKRPVPERGWRLSAYALDTPFLVAQSRVGCNAGAQILGVSLRETECHKDLLTIGLPGIDVF